MIKRIVKGGYIKIPVEPWVGKHVHRMYQNTIDNIRDVRKFLENLSIYESVEELMGDAPHLEVDERSLDSEECVAYRVDSDCHQTYEYDNIYEAIEYLCGDIPERPSIYVCRGAKGKSLRTNDFKDVVEFFYENHNVFSCDCVNYL